ncbi:hypothetical protein MSAN_00684200 [Mycena sanguinolenta]|uniref:Uncharacterized protein n=1 Tax=Mycena sanguinolenta TaxID=230812 RepID=A0A8H6Z4E2_9AGAR|nr:hypothetical protein MSAN_00684200 [Mycena sanguinolenta]
MATPFTPKPALDRLPLAARKDLRENFQDKQEDFQARIKTLLGKDFTININAEEVWAYAAEENTSTGGYFSAYVEGFISALEQFLSKYGEDGKTYFNEAVMQSQLTLTVNPLGEKAETISSDIKDGVYRILFNHKQLGYNQHWQTDHILPAVESVPREDFALSTKYSIRVDYEANVEPLRQEINKLCGAEFILDPNFDENYKVLSAANDKISEKNWRSRIGATMLSYFKGLQYQLERQGFKDDDMIHEGIQEVIHTKTFRIRVVPTTKKATETVISEGIVFLQVSSTIPSSVYRSLRSSVLQTAGV